MSLKSSTATLLLFASLLVFVNGQLVEECYWECGVEYCDYMDDYCNYDCHEVCYPVLRKLPINHPPYQSPEQIVNLTESSIPVNSPPVPFEQNQPNYNHQYPTRGIIPTQHNQPEVQRQTHEQLASLNREQVNNIGKLDAGRIGKTIKMRLENPAYETIRRGKVVLTRGSPPRGFAMFQDCLSSNHNKNPKPDVTSNQETLTTSGHHPKTFS